MRQDSDRMEANCLLRSAFAMGGSSSHNRQPCEICHCRANQKDKSNEESVTISITNQKYSFKRSYHTGIGGKTTAY